MAFPTTAEIDNFNRTEPTLSDGGKWTTYNNALQADGADATRVTDSAASGAYRNDQNYGPSVEAWADVTATGDLGLNPGVQSLGVRWDTAADNRYQVDCPRYRAGVGTHEHRVKEVTGGVETQLGASFIQDVAAGDSVGMWVTGSGTGISIAAYYKAGAGAWAQLGTRTPTTAYDAAGRIGIANIQTVAAVAAPELGSFGGGTTIGGGYVLTEASDCVNAENADRLITEDATAGVGPCAVASTTVPERSKMGVGL